MVSHFSVEAFLYILKNLPKDKIDQLVNNLIDYSIRYLENING